MCYVLKGHVESNVSVSLSWFAATDSRKERPTTQRNYVRICLSCGQDWVRRMVKPRKRNRLSIHELGLRISVMTDSVLNVSYITFAIAVQWLWFHLCCHLFVIMMSPYPVVIMMSPPLSMNGDYYITSPSPVSWEGLIKRAWIPSPPPVCFHCLPYHTLLTFTSFLTLQFNLLLHSITPSPLSNLLP